MFVVDVGGGESVVEIDGLATALLATEEDDGNGEADFMAARSPVVQP